MAIKESLSQPWQVEKLL